MVFAMFFFYIEAQVPGIGIFGVSGVIAFLVGSFLLVGGLTPPAIPQAPDEPTFRVNYFLLAGIAAGMLALIPFVTKDLTRARKLASEDRSSAVLVVGQVAVVTSPLDPQGSVHVGGEEWTAISDSGELIEKGEEVIVSESEGLTLKIFRSSEAYGDSPCKDSSQRRSAMGIINFLKDYQKMARFRWGNFEGMKGPGPVWLVPIMHSGTRVDLRTEVLDIEHQTNITKDNAPIHIDFLVYMRVMAEYADRAVLEVENYRDAVIGLATTTLRAVVGDIDLDEVLSQRERINTVLREKLDSETERWGIKVTNVEIREIEPPPDIQEAMNRQMSAERVRRAVVREADGTRAAAITVAEGEKQAAILKAEGERQAEILQAEGDRQAAVLRAQGFSTALEKIYDVAQRVDANTLSLQYFDTLKELGASPSTKFILPMEFTNLLKPFMSMTEKRSGDGQDDAG